MVITEKSLPYYCCSSLLSLPSDTLQTERAHLGSVPAFLAYSRLLLKSIKVWCTWRQQHQVPPLTSSLFSEILPKGLIISLEQRNITHPPFFFSLSAGCQEFAQTILWEEILKKFKTSRCPKVQNKSISSFEGWKVKYETNISLLQLRHWISNLSTVLLQKKRYMYISIHF